ncbi:ADP-ribosylation factor-like protein 13A [Bombina bombina]|uniref:ADP-ribosylation factor-like protein 13A n=1 Tax=Bombina bombina TaxID=8345 RepID=UPI00235B0B65|nr:ADP-ribosylation factor-like protein 13A [Bombina bombina]
MFHFLSHCWRWVQIKQEPIRRVTILVLGLENSGKSSIIRVIRRVPPCHVSSSPTDPHRTDLRLDHFDLTLLELPGGLKGRTSWRFHYPYAHALMFVVDASDPGRMQEVACVLASVLRHPRVSGKPLLILANKQDKSCAILPSEVIELLSLETLVNESQTHCRIEPCSAGTNFHSHHDWAILKGLRWILKSVSLSYPILSARVLQESAELKDSLKASRRTQVDRALPGWEVPRDNITDLVQFKSFPGEKKRPLKPIQNILSQTGHSMNNVKKRRRKVRVKETGQLQELKEGEDNKKWKSEPKGSPSSKAQQTHVIGHRALIQPEEQPSDQTAGLKKKKKKRKLIQKNQIKSQEIEANTRDTGNTFDLYRKAMQALKLKQEQQRARSEHGTQENNPHR